MSIESTGVEWLARPPLNQAPEQAGMIDCQLPQLAPQPAINALEDGTFSPYFDLELYTKLFPEKTSEQALQIVPILNKCIAGSMLTKSPNQMTLAESRQLAQQRAQFFLWMGWSQPDDPMNRQYRNFRNPSVVASDRPPATVVQSIRFVDTLYDDDKLPERIYQCRHLVLGRSYEGLQRAYRHSIRLGKVFGLDEPAVKDKLRAWPAILDLSRETRYFCLRAMVEHSEKLGVYDAMQKRPYTILANWRMQEILGHLTDLQGRGARGQERKHEGRSNFLYLLDSPRRQAIVGHRVLHAYFRADPIINPELLLEKYPRLQSFNRRTMRKWGAEQAYQQGLEHTLPAFEEITPDTPWLKWAVLPNKVIDFVALNNYARHASKRIKNFPGRQTPIHTTVLQKTKAARKNFVMEMGWYDPQHPLFTYACRIERSKYLGKKELFWPSPERISETITILSQYTDDPLHCIRVRPDVFDTDPAKLEAKLMVIKEAFPTIPDIKVVVAKNISRSPDVVRKNGARYEQKKKKLYSS